LRATREVIVSAGAIESSHLLMVSGIGATHNLRPYGIQVQAKLPGVGENFHNHVLTGVIRAGKQRVPTGNPAWPAPDLQIAFVHVPFDIIVGQTHPNAISILPGVVRPLSRGDVRHASSGPLVKPRVDPNYLAARADRLVQGVKLARELFATKAFSERAGEELLPGHDVSNSDEDLNAFVNRNADSYFHLAGSCRMGLDELAVVDQDLRVRGIEGLRIADASVMPAVPSGNCHAGIVIIAERCAEMIKATHGLHRGAVATGMVAS
jgi:choline dehydrogenase